MTELGLMLGWTVTIKRTAQFALVQLGREGSIPLEAWRKRKRKGEHLQ